MIFSDPNNEPVNNPWDVGGLVILPRDANKA